jgi:hypothetical protein
MKLSYTVLAVAMTVGTLHGMQTPQAATDQEILDKITELQVCTAMQQISLLGIATQMHPFTKMAQLVKIQKTLEELQPSTKDPKLKQKIMHAFTALASLLHKLEIECPEALLWAEAERKKAKEKQQAEQTASPTVHSNYA